MKILLYTFCLELLAYVKCKEKKSVHVGAVVELYDPTRFPFYAQLRCPVFGKPGKATRCGGSLIHRRWILTAAHCFPNHDHEIKWMLQQEMPMVFMGSTRIFNFQFARRNSFIAIYRHPNYSWIEYDGKLNEIRNDIALAKLKEPYETTPTIDIIQLSASRVKCNEGALIGMGLAVFGTNDTFSTNVKYAKLMIKKYVGLNNLNRSFNMTTFYTEGRVGWGQPNSYMHSDSSGGPFFCTISSTAVQIGVLSWGTTTNTSVRSTFERVDLFLDVILEHVPDVKLFKGNYEHRSNKLQTGIAPFNFNGNVISLVFCLLVIV